MLFRLRIIILIFIVPNIFFAQLQKIEGHKLKEDLLILRDLAVELSPKLNIDDKNKIIELYNLKAKEITEKQLSVFEFLEFVNRIETDLKFDEHSTLSLPAGEINSIVQKSKLFPLPVKFIDNDLVVNSNSFSIPYGSVIHSINGEQIGSILKKFYKKDETIDSFKKKSIEQQFGLYLLIFGNHINTKTFKVSYKESFLKNSLKEMKIEGVTLNEYISYYNTVIYPLNRRLLAKQVNTHYYEDSNTYYFQLNSFSWLNDENANSYAKLKREFNEVFKEIKKTKSENLIIDLRFNGGGDVDVPGLLYSFIALDKFRETIKTTMPDMEVPLVEHIIKLDGVKVEKSKDIKKFIKRIKNDFKKEKTEYIDILSENEVIKPNKNAFKGKVYLLIGGNTFSASTYFTALFKSNERGVIIGEQIGGSHHDITGGQYITYQLPNTKIEVRVPLMVVSFSEEIKEKTPEHKILPDIKLPKKVRYQYFLHQQDPELQEAFKLIKNTSKF